MSEERLNEIQELIERKILLAEVSGGLTATDIKLIDLWNYAMELQQELTKYKERCEKAIDKLYCWGEVLNAEFQQEMLEILQDKENENEINNR